MVCGSRTELCIDCGRYVTLRDQQDHSRTCLSTDWVSQVSPNKMKPGTDADLERIKDLSWSPARASSFTAGLSVTSDRCKASLSVEDQLTHQVLKDFEIVNLYFNLQSSL